MQIKFFFRLPFLYDDYWDENDNSNKQDIIITRIIGLIHNIYHATFFDDAILKYRTLVSLKLSRN